MSYRDRVLFCWRCRQKFVLTADEQEFRAAHGQAFDPRHCRSCRAALAPAPAAPGPEGARTGRSRRRRSRRRR